jgi:hypothetical protein
MSVFIIPATPDFTNPFLRKVGNKWYNIITKVIKIYYGQ